MQRTARESHFGRLLQAGLVFMAVVALASDRAQAEPESLDLSVAGVADQLAQQLSGRRWSVAVPDLATLDGRLTVLGRYVAEELITTLYARRVAVVERSLLDRTMSELRLGTTDLMDSAQVKRFGYLVGAQAIIAGTLTDLGDAIKLNVRVVDVETGQVVGAGAAMIPKDAVTLEMWGQTAPRRWPTPVRP
jgi:TolB-like protein